MATRRMMQPSPRSQFHGNSAKVQRLPVTLSMSPPTFSMPKMPFLNRMRWTGSQSGKSSFQSRPPDHALYSSARCGCSGPLRCGPMAVASGWSLACVSWPTTLTFFSTNHSPADGTKPGARQHRRAGGLLEIVVGDRLPLLLGNRDHDSRAEEVRQRNLVDERRALHHVRRRIDMRGVVHARRDALRQDPGLGVVVDALDLDVFEVGPVGGLVTETVGQVVELEPHAVGEVLLERDAADFFRHRNSSL